MILAWLRRLIGPAPQPPPTIQVVLRRLVDREGTLPIATPEDYHVWQPPPDAVAMSEARRAAIEARRATEEAAQPHAKLTARSWFDAETGDEGLDIFVDGDLFEDWLLKRLNGEPSRLLPPDAAQKMSVLLANASTRGWCAAKPPDPEMLRAYDAAETPEDGVEAMLLLAAKRFDVSLVDDEQLPWWQTFFS
jgi:hypothetical protein